jgi:hypothetical protein
MTSSRPLLPLLLLAIGCTQSAPIARDATATIDTLPGGAVRVVNREPTQWADTNGWKLVREVTFTPPEAGPGSLGLPGMVVMASTGEILVLDEKPVSINLYSATGQFVRAIGRRGAGPGEYGDGADLLLHRDTVVVNDRANGRMVLFRLDGSLIAMVSAISIGAPASGISDDGLITTTSVPGPPGSQATAPRAGAIRAHLDGTVVDTLIFPTPPPLHLWTLPTARLEYGSPIPFTPQRPVGMDRAGQLVWGYQDQYRLIVAPHGLDTARIIEAPAAAVPIEESLRRAAFDNVVKGDPWVATRGSLDDVPRFYPLWTDFSFDGEGRLWVLRPGPRGQADHWDLFDRDGVLLGAVPAPFGETPSRRLFWQKDRLVRVGENEDGVAVIEVWRLKR